MTIPLCISVAVTHLYVVMAVASGRLLCNNVRHPNSVLVQLCPGARQFNPIIVEYYPCEMNKHSSGRI